MNTPQSIKNTSQTNKTNHFSRPKVNTKQTLKRLLNVISHGNKFVLIVVLFCIIISSLASVGSSLFIKTIIDNYITPMLNTGSREFGELVKIILLMVVFFSAEIITTYLYTFLMVKLSQSTIKKIRNKMFKNMQRLPIRYFDTNTHGNIMSHYTNDTDVLELLISQSLPNIISSFITIVAVFSAMIYLSIYLTLLTFLFLLVMLFVTKKLGQKSRNYFISQQGIIGKTTGYIEEMINGQKVIKVFNHEEAIKKDFDKINEELCYNSTQANKYANLFMPIMTNIGNLQYVVVAIVGGILALLNVNNLSIVGISVMSIGTISGFIQLSKAFVRPLSTISQQAGSILNALAGAERIFKLIDQPLEIDDGKYIVVNAKYNKKNHLVECEEKTNIFAFKDTTKKRPQLIRVLGDVRFKNVNFGYNPNKLVLKDINLYAKPGQKVAFVGATGAGKTTITNLINRFYDINEGEILFDGINIKEIKKDDLRKCIGIVLQDTNLFTGTVKENIRYGNLEATDEEVYNAAKLANADEFIQLLPNGYDTMLESDGANLSQGQRQLLSIARTAVANPPIMILDEATSSIDTHTESLVQKGMDALMQNRTVFVIAHRLSTVQNSNVIMVLENGVIIERGTHEDLINQKGKYFQLYTGKFELE